ncbi:hypothetical protein [Streptomyces sp. NPDC006691]|uniref:hypothetical protein n=1 Tax=Streptomyces sp. NPDC006691 TaxID=3364757 RepID=UPI003691C2B5
MIPWRTALYQLATALKLLWPTLVEILFVAAAWGVLRNDAAGVLAKALEASRGRPGNQFPGYPFSRSRSRGKQRK